MESVVLWRGVVAAFFVVGVLVIRGTGLVPRHIGYRRRLIAVIGAVAFDVFEEGVASLAMMGF